MVQVEDARPVRAVVVEPRSTASSVQWPGEVRPRVESRLGFRVGGKMSLRTVSVGDRVSPGQVLMRLDPTTCCWRSQAQAALGARNRPRPRGGRARAAANLRGQNFISQALLDRQQATFDAANARLAAAEAQQQQARNAIDFQVLRADVAGVVTAVEAEVGQVVAAGQVVIRVAQAGEREIAINVPESDLRVAREARDHGW